VVHAGARGRALFEESGSGDRGREEEEEEDPPTISFSLPHISSFSSMITLFPFSFKLSLLSPDVKSTFQIKLIFLTFIKGGFFHFHTPDLHFCLL
jgi:hypothetical protein